MSINKDLEEIRALLTKKGIGTYVIGVKDPDTNDEAYMSNGSPSWCVGITEMIKHDIVFGSDDDED